MTTICSFPIFRAVDPRREAPGQLRQRQSTKRRPGNVPFLVDNLWEWKRWKEYPNLPSRRFSVFASPRAELARKLALTGETVFRVELVGEFKMCQVLDHPDSKVHDECLSLPNQLLDGLGQPWLDAPREEKAQAGKLWLPCLEPEEVEELFEMVPELRQLRQDIWNSVTYWQGLAMVANAREIRNLEGELFFEPSSRPGEGYILRPLE